MVNNIDVIETIKKARVSAEKVTGVTNPTSMCDHNRLNDSIFDFLKGNLPTDMKFKDAINIYHEVEKTDDISAEAFRSMMEQRFGSVIR